MHLKSYKLLLNTCKALFRCQVAGLHCVVDKVLIVNGFVHMSIYTIEVGVEDFCDAVQLAHNTAGLFYLLHDGGVGCVLHIGSNVLE